MAKMKSLKVYIDYKSPYAFIAKEPTYALEAIYGIEIDWYPLTLNIGSYLGTAKTDKQGRVVENNRSPRQWLVVKYAYRDARRYASLRHPQQLATHDSLAAYKACRCKAKYRFEIAERQRDCNRLGLTLDQGLKTFEASYIHLAMLWLQQAGKDLRAFVETAYRYAFIEQQNLTTMPALLRLVSGLISERDLKAFTAFLGDHDRLIVHQDKLLAKGIFDSPAYRVAGEIFHGRQHLPLIRWHLTGRQGVPPV